MQKRIHAHPVDGVPGLLQLSQPIGIGPLQLQQRVLRIERGERHRSQQTHQRPVQLAELRGGGIFRIMQQRPALGQQPVAQGFGVAVAVRRAEPFGKG